MIEWLWAQIRKKLEHQEVQAAQIWQNAWAVAPCPLIIIPHLLSSLAGVEGCFLKESNFESSDAEERPQSGGMTSL